MTLVSGISNTLAFQKPISSPSSGFWYDCTSTEEEECGHNRTLMMDTKSASGILVDLNHLSWLSARDLAQLCRCENLKI